MARFLGRAGGLIVAGALVYLAVAEIWFGGANSILFRRLIISGAVCLALCPVFWILGRGAAVLAGRGCPRCGRRVGRGRIYCDEHRQETINEYRDRQRP